MAKKIDKTNAARLFDRAKVAYELIPYTVDEDNLAATHVAEELGEDIATVFKTLGNGCCMGITEGLLLIFNKGYGV